ncbi:MAG TPA: polymer-forming cytoskeletal protein [Gemmatimonadales bacterium]
MPAGRRHTALLILATLIQAGRLLAAAPSDGTGHLTDRVRRMLLASLVNESGPIPQAVQRADSQGPSVNPAQLGQPALLERQLRSALRKPIGATRLTVVGGSARIGRYSVGSDESIHGHVVVLEGDAEVHGRVEGNVVALDGDITVFPGGSIVGDALAIGGRIHTVGTGTISGSEQTLDAAVEPLRPPQPIVTQIARHAAGLAGLLMVLTVLGFGIVTFGRPNLEIVSDTVAHSFGRSFLAGLLGQVLVLPTFGMLVVGLALTIAGALLLPFAIAVYLVLVLVTTLVGLLAVAHAMGERITRRRMARGIALSPNAYRYVATGLGTVAVIWLAWVVFGWVPVAGTLMLAAAMLTTWTLATVGFGAALLSRGGIREHFAGRLVPPDMMTDEYLWATPQFGVAAVKRPPRDDR